MKQDNDTITIGDNSNSFAVKHNIDKNNVNTNTNIEHNNKTITLATNIINSKIITITRRNVVQDEETKGTTRKRHYNIIIINSSNDNICNDNYNRIVGSTVAV